jgi:hypothetical protein
MKCHLIHKQNFAHVVAVQSEKHFPSKMPGGVVYRLVQQPVKSAPCTGNSRSLAWKTRRTVVRGTSKFPDSSSCWLGKVFTYASNVPYTCTWPTSFPPRTLTVSMNFLRHALMLSAYGGSFLKCMRKFHSTWKSDFVSKTNTHNGFV